MALKGSEIPGYYNLASLVDRSLYLFRYRAYQYLMITLLSYGIVSLLMAWWFFGGEDFLEDDFFWGGFYVNSDLKYYFLFLSIPSLFTDIALQYYTSYLIREREITWSGALRRAFSPKVFHLLLSRITGGIVLTIMIGIGIFIVFIPFIGFFAYPLIVAGAYSVTSGMAHAIIVEERKDGFSAVGRNFQLGFTNLGISAFSAFAGFMITLALMICCIFFFYLLSMLVINLLKGTMQVMIDSKDISNYMLFLLVYLFPIIQAVFYVPLTNIFYSLMYYGFRSYKEGFHLENKIDLYTQRKEEELKKKEETNGAGEIKIPA